MWHGDNKNLVILGDGRHGQAVRALQSQRAVIMGSNPARGKRMCDHLLISIYPLCSFYRLSSA